jgi:hypothetical protein
MFAMKRSATAALLFCVAALFFASSASAQVWVEVGDAPDGVPGRQDTVGIGPLSSISGAINRGQGDHVDTYSIMITDPSQFLATTKIDLGGSAVTATGTNADSRLWLWTDTGVPVLGNDDINAFGTDTLASLVSDPSTFPALSQGELVNPTAANISLQPNTKYLLSFSIFSNDPDDAGGVDMVDLGSDFDALHGPNPAAGAFAAWENAASTTAVTYRIALRGATFCSVPEPVSLGLVVLGAFSLILARRRK